MPKPATAMPATSATTTIFRWVERSAECNEWFISASRRLYRRLIGDRSIPRLFHDGFVDSPKWFHRTSRWPGDAGQWPSGMAGHLIQTPCGWWRFDGNCLQAQTNALGKQETRD